MLTKTYHVHNFFSTIYIMYGKISANGRPFINFRVRIRVKFKIKVRFRVRIKDSVRVGMVFRVRVWFCFYL